MEPISIVPTGVTETVIRPGSSDEADPKEPSLYVLRVAASIIHISRIGLRPALRA